MPTANMTPTMIKAIKTAVVPARAGDPGGNTRSLFALDPAFAGMNGMEERAKKTVPPRERGDPGQYLSGSPLSRE
jgi:hypothetical protein